MPTLIQRLRTFRFPFVAPPIDPAVPFWVSCPPRPRSSDRVRILPNDSLTVPARIITRDPPDFDPTR